MLVLDGEVGGLIETRRLAELCRLGAVGIHVLWLERRPSHTPLGCSATVTTVRKGMATVVSVPGAEPKQVRWESLPDDRLERLAHHLAPRRDGDRAGTGAGLPAAVSLAALAIPAAIEGTLAASIGLGPDGPVTIDLRRDGPHVLVAGTTGAGKSELLRTLVAGLAMAHSPRRLNFVIVDFKGGTGIGPLAELPHVAGMITDLDVGEAQRLRLGLEAEVERRLRILAGAGLENLAALEVRDPAAAPPAIVLVIDEFAALARQAPAVLDGLIDLAQRGEAWAFTWCWPRSDPEASSPKPSAPTPTCAWWPAWPTKRNRSTFWTTRLPRTWRPEPPAGYSCGSVPQHPHPCRWHSRGRRWVAARR